jgi:ferric-dicitrate binding protein FerR (iron transport regulator)
MLNDRKIYAQISALLADECSPAEREAILHKIDTDRETAEAYSVLKQVWEFNKSAKDQPVTVDVDKAWHKVGKYVNAGPLEIIYGRDSHKSRFNKVLKYVSGIAALLLVTFGVYYFLVLNKPNGLQTVASANNSTLPVNLADGSLITLNKASQLKFPDKFGSNSREVYFWGEAFFEIASDPSRPFVIETGDARVKVLGTSFNIKSNAGNGITEVVVKTGTVLFYYVDKTDQILGQVILQKGEKGIYNRSSHSLLKENDNDPNNLSWKTGILVFNKTSLDKVLHVVGEKYGVNIRINDQKLSTLKLTATFDNESLESVLEVISLVHKLQFTHDGKDYLVNKVTG